ncbi:MAG: IPT/TIG domain-containing protein [Bacteroidales bacterium]|nr:IPT/TIG domain-containing protein [Bacteroidales bacterium]
MKRIFINYGWCLLLCAMGFVSCEEKDAGAKKDWKERDPSRSHALTTFFPDSGRIAEKMFLDGENFGTNTENIKVYFNSKRAAVVTSTGNRLYVLCPKMPGDTCDVSVVIGNDSLVYPKQFRYYLSVTVSTVTGNGQEAFVPGTLAEASLEPMYLAVDNEDNIFVTLREDTYWGVVKVSEADNSVIPLVMNSASGSGTPNSLAVDLTTGVVTVPIETWKEVFWTCDPSEAWAPRTKKLNWAGGTEPSGLTNTWKHCLAACPYDGYVYTRFYNGHVVKIHPKTLTAELVYQTPQGNSYGMAFNPKKPSLLYFSFNSGVSGNLSHSIAMMDVAADVPGETFRKLSGSTAGGHRDGELANSMFYYPRQIYFDPDGYLYIADDGNDCIRRITPDNIVETVVGVPGKRSYQDGGKDEALFAQPRGVGVSKDGTVYVADYGNRRIRKLSIE